MYRSDISGTSLPAIHLDVNHPARLDWISPMGPVGPIPRGAGRAKAVGNSQDRYPDRAMAFRPAALGDRPAPGQVDYRLARRQVLDELRRGRLSRIDVCDAHPELVRNGMHLGVPAPEPCPVCEASELVLVTYLFGPRLPASGRCVSSPRELARYARQRTEVAAYEVEVCLACAWHHLVRSFGVGGRSNGS
jgi:hypothetical protein